MEATKKTSTSKAALLVIAALSMLLSGLFVATASRSDAVPPPACPDGFSLTADEKNCFQAAVITSADNPNSCATGELTPDGTKCFTLARVIPQEGVTLCPAGFSPDDSLGGMCARFEVASQRAETCPAGARGIADGCYILVAKGPAGAATCTTGTLSGSNCVIKGDPPVNGTSTCPVSATVRLDGAQCYTLVSKDNISIQCNPAVTGYNAAPYELSDGICKVVPANNGDLLTDAFSCPAAAIGAGTHFPTDVGTHMKIGICELTGSGVGACPTGTSEDPNGVDCRKNVEQTPGALTCADSFGLVNNECVRFDFATTSDPQCPSGSVEDLAGDCRKPVANATGEYYCKDANAALNGKTCVFSSGFLSEPSPNLYKCDEGVRTVIGTGTAVENICILGDADANTTSGPSCLQGVLSTDNAFCIVPRIDAAPAVAVAAPVPSFTG